MVSESKRWVERRSGAARGAGLAGVEPVVSRVLAGRGLDGDAARAFIDARLTALHDPSLLPGCDRAAERLLAAAQRGERIAIYGDYDADGVCATAILYHTLKLVAPGADVVMYVPHRIDEGYGLNAAAIGELAAGGARVIVSVDCGITAVEEARAARDLGVDLIITDHHNARGEGSPGGMVLPDAYAVVHPRVPGADGVRYPFGDLCGAAVAFKVAWRIAALHAGGSRVGGAGRERLLDMLALAGLATITDVVPLVGENRVIAKFGLVRIRSTAIEGLGALVEVSGLAGESVTAEGAGFALGPRLNACGRMGHAREAVELLTVARGAQARDLAMRLDALNAERRRCETRIFEDASDRVEQSGLLADGSRAIVLAGPGWHAGVVGIVCSRLVGRYCRPAILVCGEGELLRGSGRSIDGFSLHAGLAACAEELESFGGHDMAAGLAVRPDRFDRFASRFTEFANTGIGAEMLVPAVRFDCEASIAELTVRAAQQFDGLGPFGRENPQPSLLVRGARVTGDAQPMGQHGKHIQVRLGGAGSSVELRVVGWGWGDRASGLRRGAVVDAIIAPKLNRFRGRESAEAELIDLRPAGR